MRSAFQLGERNDATRERLVDDELREFEQAGNSARNPDSPPVYRSVGTAAGAFFGAPPMLYPTDPRGAGAPFGAFEPYLRPHSRSDHSQSRADKLLFLPPQPAGSHGLLPLAKRPLFAAPAAP